MVVLYVNKNDGTSDALKMLFYKINHGMSYFWLVHDQYRCM